MVQSPPHSAHCVLPSRIVNAYLVRAGDGSILMVNIPLKQSMCSGSRWPLSARHSLRCVDKAHNGRYCMHVNKEDEDG